MLLQTFSVSHFSPSPSFRAPPLFSPISLFSIDQEELLEEGMSGPVIANTKVSQESGAGKCFVPSRTGGTSPGALGTRCLAVPIPSWCWQDTEVWASGEQRLLLLHLINLLLIVANGILQFPRPSPGAMAAPQEGGWGRGLQASHGIPSKPPDLCSMLSV